MAYFLSRYSTNPYNEVGEGMLLVAVEGVDSIFKGLESRLKNFDRYLLGLSMDTEDSQVRKNNCGVANN